MELIRIDPVSGREVASEDWELFAPKVLSALKRGWRIASHLAAPGQAGPSLKLPSSLQAESISALGIDDRWGVALVIHGVLKTLHHLPNAYLVQLIQAYRREQQNMTEASDEQMVHRQYQGLFALDRSVRDHVSELFRCQMALDRAVLRAQPEWSARVGVSANVTLPLGFNGDARHGLTFALCEFVGQLAENDQLAKLLENCAGSIDRTSRKEARLRASTA